MSREESYKRIKSNPPSDLMRIIKTLEIADFALV